MAWSKMVNLALSDDEREDMMPWTMGDSDSGPAYPPGMTICLCKPVLDKMAEADPMYADDPEIGDIIELRCFARVTSVSMTQRADGEHDRRVELQITDLAFEDESTEDSDDDE